MMVVIERFLKLIEELINNKNLNKFLGKLVEKKISSLKDFKFD